MPKTVTLSDGSYWRYDALFVSRLKWILAVLDDDDVMAEVPFLANTRGPLTASDHRKIADVLDGAAPQVVYALALVKPNGDAKVFRCEEYSESVEGARIHAGLIHEENPECRLIDLVEAAALPSRDSDPERLDWLNENPNAVGWATGYHGSKGSWNWIDNSNAHASIEGASLRAAIDAARGQEAP